MDPSRPLRGRTVVVTRPAEQAAALAEPLRRLGAEIVLAPTIRIEARPPDAEVRDVLRRLAGYDTVVFTSVNGVRIFLDYLGDHAAGPAAGGGRTPAGAGGWSSDGTALAGLAVAAIGPATAAALAERGVACDVVADDHVAEGLVDTLVGQGLADAGARVLIPAARRARPVLPDALRARGARVDVLAVYDTVPAERLDVPAERVERADFITFTSSSTAEEFAGLLAAGPADAGRPLAERLAGARLCSIGPVTSSTLRALGLTVAVESAEHTVAGLVAAIAAAANELS